MAGAIFLRSLGLTVLTFLFLSCAAHRSLPPVSLDFFVPAPRSDPWQHKIREWQARHRQDPAAKKNVRAPKAKSELARDYQVFSRDLRRGLVRDTVAWVQARAPRYYRADGDRDHWATLSEVIQTGGDDCDGLDLLTFVLLRRLGFRGEEIYRSILVERDSGQHHMVTLWFENGDRHDPFVLDPTAVVTKGMVRLSEIKGWEPIQLFDESTHYRVEPAPFSDAVAQR